MLLGRHYTDCTMHGTVYILCYVSTSYCFRVQLYYTALPCIAPPKYQLLYSCIDINASNILIHSSITIALLSCFVLHSIVCMQVTTICKFLESCLYSQHVVTSYTQIIFLLVSWLNSYRYSTHSYIASQLILGFSLVACNYVAIIR